MNRKLAIGALVSALLLSGLMVGVSYGEDVRISEPSVLELRFRLEGPGAHLRDFRLEGGGQITLTKSLLFDADGNEVGVHRASCTVADDTGWVCTFVSTIQDGPLTDKGTVVASGVYRGEHSTYTVTGGTGAYLNVGGRAVGEDDGSGRVDYTLYLVP